MENLPTIIDYFDLSGEYIEKYLLPFTYEVLIEAAKKGHVPSQYGCLEKIKRGLGEFKGFNQAERINLLLKFWNNLYSSENFKDSPIFSKDQIKSSIIDITSGKYDNIKAPSFDLMECAINAILNIKGLDDEWIRTFRGNVKKILRKALVYVSKPMKGSKLPKAKDYRTYSIDLCEKILKEYDYGILFAASKAGHKRSQFACVMKIVYGINEFKGWSFEEKIDQLLHLWRQIIKSPLHVQRPLCVNIEFIAGFITDLCAMEISFTRTRKSLIIEKCRASLEKIEGIDQKTIDKFARDLEL